MATTSTMKSAGSANSKSKLEDQAATAALYVTRNDAAAKKNETYLDSNNKLSSAGAAASLKYARPQDLPSYPSSGLKKNDSAAGAAASLGWANQKKFEHWKPDPSASAYAAATLAKDYKMKPLWQPEASANGAKAAVLAHRDGAKVEVWKPEVSDWGNSAANLAFKKHQGVESTPVDYGYTTLGRQGSLMAATGAMSSSRKRADSTPLPPPETYPDERNASGNAMKAAMSVSRKSRSDDSGGVVGGAVPFTNMPREMFTSNPPVAPEVNELNRQNTLRASAVAMARGIYAQQQKSIDQATNAQASAAARHKRKPSNASTDSEPPQMYLGNLQEAAHKLAQERLAKLHDDHAKNREYRDYYGHSQPQTRMSIRGRTRRRASSDGNYDEDREQSNKIRAQMSIFSSNVGQVDEKKRAKDREALIAVAQRNVTNRLHGMDEKVFADTGKVAPSLLSDWEIKAHAAAQANSNTRLVNHGKVDIGGGRFIDQSEVDAVAAKNVQPVLDEINEKAAIERERQATIKAENMEQQRKADELKQREKESKAINKKLRQQDKDEEKLRKADEKAAKDEEKRLEKEKRKSLNTKPAEIVTSNTTEPTTETAAEIEPSRTSQSSLARPHVPPAIRTSMEDQASLRMRENAEAANADESSPMSLKEGSRMKSWLKRLSKRQSKNPKSPTSAEAEPENEKEKAFIGGIAMKRSSANNSTVSLGAKSSSIRDVAMAGKGKEKVPSEDERPGRSHKRNSQVSSMSSLRDTDDEEFQEARDNFDEDRLQPSALSADRSSSVARDSKFKEAI